MSSPEQMNISFRQQSIDYHINLVQGKKSDHLVEINGITYAVLGDKDKLKTACEILNSVLLFNISNSEDLKKILSTRSDISFPIENIENLGIRILSTKANESALSDINDKKAKVLNQLTPTWPVPGTATTFSMTDRMKDLGVPGIRISVFNRGENWSEGFGELEKADLRVQAASISKTITALTIT